MKRLSYNELPKLTKVAIDRFFIVARNRKGYLGGVEVIREYSGNDINCLMGERQLKSDTDFPVAFWIKQLKYKNLLTKEIEEELFCFIFGGDNEEI